MVIVTNKRNKDKTIKYCKQFYNFSTEEAIQRLIILKYTKIDYIFMIIDPSLYKARGVDYELRFRILLLKLKFFIRGDKL